MHREDITETFSNSDLRELLGYSKELLLTVDEIIRLTPIPQASSSEQRALRLLFMDARTASYDICILAESLLDNDSHHFSRAIEYSMRLLWETMIDYFYIFEADDSVAERYLEFLDLVNSKNCSDYTENRKAFEAKYENTHRGDYWSGKSREDKVTQGVNKQPKNNISELGNLKRLFEYLNEQVHGNVLVGLYWDFNKHGRFEYVYRGQVVAGLLSVWIYYSLSEAYCKFTGRGSEINRFECYEAHVKPIFLRNQRKANSK